MSIKIAISGFGRIGRNVLRALYEYNRRPELKIVAINDLCEQEVLAHLTRYDTAHGAFPFSVELEQDHLIVDGDPIKLLSCPDPEQLPWQALDVDVVMECSGRFVDKEGAGKHLKAGAKRVIIGAPAKGGGVKTVVYGVNHQELRAADQLISSASCTTNCLAPLLKPLVDEFGVAQGMMTTIHSYTNDQVLTDLAHKDLRRARAAAHNMIPTSTGAAIALKLVIPELEGKLDGFSLRVPTINVSCVDLNVQLNTEVSVETLNACLKEASETSLKGVLGYNLEPLVSSDFNHCPMSSIYDATQTLKLGNTYKLVAWYDNEWGYSNRMLDNAKALLNAP